MKNLADLLVRADPTLVGMDHDDVLYEEAEVRIKATHVIELLPYHKPSVLDPYRDRPPRKLLAVLEHDDKVHVSFVTMSFAAGDSPVLWERVFCGCGPSANLRELRHTYWGDNGYIHSPPGRLIAEAFKHLGRWFDCGGLK